MGQGREQFQLPLRLDPDFDRLGRFFRLFHSWYYTTFTTTRQARDPTPASEQATALSSRPLNGDGSSRAD